MTVITILSVYAYVTVSVFSFLKTYITYTNKHESLHDICLE